MTTKLEAWTSKMKLTSLIHWTSKVYYFLNLKLGKLLLVSKQQHGETKIYGGVRYTVLDQANLCFWYLHILEDPGAV